MKLRVKNSLICGTALMGAFLPSVATARTEVTPYIEVSQVLDAELKGDKEVLTYTSAAAGIEVSMDGPRTQAQVSYRYEHRFGWGKNTKDSDIHSGLARVNQEIINNTLSFEAGALATRSRGDIRGDAPALLSGDSSNVSQVYSVYGGPTLTTRAGPVEIGAAYRLAYTTVDSNDFVPAPGQPRLDSYEDAIAHQASVSVGMSPGQLPFGWQVTGAYEREDANQLDQRFEAKGVRGDVTVPVTPTLALLGGVGYENVEISERAPLLDVNGDPVVDGKGRFVTNSASPRLVGYDFDGIYWDVGVGWKPSRRTSLEAHVGRRYGSWSYTGSVTWQPSENSAFQLGAYDQVETFGQQLTDSLAELPTNFGVGRNPFGNQFNGCVFSAGTDAGGCLNPALQSATNSAFRSRGVVAQYSASRGPMSAGVALGYAQRKFRAPNVPGRTFTVNGEKDESWYGQGSWGYRLSPNSAIDASVYASLYDSGILGAPNVLTTGATGSYSHNFGRKLSATAALGLYSSKVEGEEGDLNASALVGVRYGF